MKKILYFLKAYGLTLVLVFGIGTQIVNCNGAATDDIADLLPDDGDTGGGGGTGGSTDFGDEDEFYIGVDTTINPVAHVRTSGSFSTKCAIPKDSLTSQDLICIVDVPEGNLYYSGLKLTYNVPKGMCQSLGRGTYWFYNKPTGIGPGFVQLYADKIVTINTVSGTSSTTFPGTYSCIVGNTSGTVLPDDPGCDEIPELNVRFTSGTGTTQEAGTFQFNCIYDQSGSAGTNCCFGEVTEQVIDRVVTFTDGVSATSTVARKPPFTRPWGGNYKNCIGGPGKTDWTEYGDDDFPYFLRQSAIEGLKSDYTVKAPNAVLNAADISNIHVSNYYVPVSHTHTTIGGSPSSTTMPYAINPIDDLSGSAFIDSVPNEIEATGEWRGAPANDNYTFMCMDSGQESTHRIRVYVREWDTYTDYLTYITSQGVSGNPDNKGVAPATNCEGVPGNCNDFNDFDDFVNALPGGAYSTAVSATTRARNFPNLRYK